MGAYFPLLFIPSFLTIWCGVCYIISQCGWRSFAQRYPAQEPIDGRWFYARSANFGKAGTYRRCLNVCLNEAGVYVEVVPIFRIGHPSLFIPWEQVARICNRSYHNHMWVALVLETGDKRMRIILPAEAEGALKSLPNDAAHRIDYESSSISVY